MVGVVAFAAAALAAEAKPVPLDEQGHAAGLAGVRLPARGAGAVRLAVRRARRARGRWPSVEVVERGVSLRGAFNAATYGLSAFASALPAFLLGWTARGSAAANADTLDVLAFSGGAVYLVTNVMLVAIAVTLAQGVPLRRDARTTTSATPARPSSIMALHLGARGVAVEGATRPSRCCWRGRSSRSRSTSATPTGPCSPMRDAETDALTRARKPPLVPDRPARGARAGGVDPRDRLARVDRHRRLQEHQRPLRTPGRRPGPAAGGRRRCARSSEPTAATGSAARSSR